jgi:hypothetical protein
MGGSVWTSALALAFTRWTMVNTLTGRRTSS